MQEYNFSYIDVHMLTPMLNCEQMDHGCLANAPNTHGQYKKTVVWNNVSEGVLDGQFNNPHTAHRKI